MSIGGFFQAILNWSPFWSVVILAFLITLATTIVYKYFTNQSEMKRLKEAQDEFKKKSKDLRDKPEEMLKMQKEMMSKNMEYMKHSFKAMLITMLPVLLIFTWMSGHLSFEPIYPGESYSITALFEKGTTGNAELVVDQDTTLLSEPNQTITESGLSWRMKSATEGEHYLTIKVGKEEQTAKVLITKELKYAPAATVYQDSAIKQININYNKLRPLGNFTVPLFNWQPGWLGLYIIFSLLFSVSMRKAFKVY